MLVLALAVLSATQAPAGAVAFRQACLDAGTDAVVLNVAAHPDDEAARTLVYLRRTLGVRTVALFTTCGEGGQNAIGRDIGQALAKRRVLETMAAAQHTGVEVRWLGFDDFGFSKSLDETLKVWGAGTLERAMLDALRQVAPDVVLTNHDTVRGHGHHRASAWAIERAIQTYVREIGRDVPLYQRPADEEDPATFTLDVSLLDAAAGKTFARQAHEGLLEHASQGPWGPHDPARVRTERWKLVWPASGSVGVVGAAAAGDPFAAMPSAFDDEATVARVLGIDASATRDLRDALASLREDRPFAAHLATARAARQTLTAAALAPPTLTSARLRRRLDALARVWLHGHGVSVEAYALHAKVPIFGRATIRVAVHAEKPQQVENLTVSWQGVPGEPAVDGPLGAWVRKIDFYLLPPGVGSERDPTGACVLRPTVSFDLAGERQIVRPRVRVLPLPALELTWDRDVCVLPRHAKHAHRVLSLDIDYHGDGRPQGELSVVGTDSITCELRPTKVEVSAERREARALLRLLVPNPGELPESAHLVARYADSVAKLPLRVVAVEVPPTLKVGLVRGPDDTLLRTLQDLGVAYTELDERALAVRELSDFTTVALDIRTASSRPDLHDHRERLLEFCAKGGRIVAFYHKPREWNARDGRPTVAPFELVVGNDRVSEEDAPVEILAPTHPLLTTPHAITLADFADWQQERGLNFPEKWGPQWTPLLRMADAGEKPSDSALLVAPYGDGTFVYCSLALYRQWRTGHEGALRLLINLLGA